MNNQQLFEKMANEYMPCILGWAIKKTGSRDAGEDLTQEVFVQFFTAAATAERVEKPENLLWKIAYYCWCHYLRNNTKQKTLVELGDAVNMSDDTDFVHKLLSAIAKTLVNNPIRVYNIKNS
jgi:DNA-directed RNA polymerase specialized sigma24 family protein